MTEKKSQLEKNVFIAKELKLKIPSDKNNLKNIFPTKLGEIPAGYPPTRHQIVGSPTDVSA